MTLNKIPVKKYKYTNDWKGKIKKVPITKETDLSVFFGKSGRSLKNTRHTVYFDTPKEVYEWELSKRKQEMEKYQKQYEYTRDRYNQYVKDGIILI